jgi:hypothetical protein
MGLFATASTYITYLILRSRGTRTSTQFAGFGNFGGIIRSIMQRPYSLLCLLGILLTPAAAMLSRHAHRARQRTDFVRALAADPKLMEVYSTIMEREASAEAEKAWGGGTPPDGAVPCGQRQCLSNTVSKFLFGAIEKASGFNCDGADAAGFKEDDAFTKAKRRFVAHDLPAKLANLGSIPKVLLERIAEASKAEQGANLMGPGKLGRAIQLRQGDAYQLFKAAEEANAENNPSAAREENFRLCECSHDTESQFSLARIASPPAAYQACFLARGHAGGAEACQAALSRVDKTGEYPASGGVWCGCYQDGELSAFPEGMKEAWGCDEVLSSR